MKIRMSWWTLLLAAATAGGCSLPHNSGHKHLAEHRPLVPRRSNVLPPAAMLMHPGPGVDGPGPGVLMAMPPMGVIPAITSQVGFFGPDGMKVYWDVTAPGMFDSEPLIVPGRYDFPQGAIYRLKLTDIPGRPGIELYPTLEIGPTTPRTEAYLAHNFIPFQLTAEDFDQVLSGNFVTKVIYLPDPEFQELALAGVETLVSTRLDPGVDPIVEADRRGSILAIIRIGNKDLQSPAAGEMAGAADGDVVQTGFHRPVLGGHHGACGPNGCPLPSGYAGEATAWPPAFVAGVTAPTYGMPISGTPIGLPGPPHIPLGVPAGLQRHTISNHTHMHIPGPTRKIDIHVRQRPGLSYPKPASRVHIVERNDVRPAFFHQPHADRRQWLPGAPYGDAACSDCQDGYYHE
jgi:hypothetical protein